ncbi:MAG: DUF1616 domain-containing protein [Chloroflexota bacterium]
MYSYHNRSEASPTMRIRLPNELLLITVLSGLLIIIISVFPDSILRLVLGLPLVLYFPGYALIAAVFPRREALGTTERVALSFGLSITLAPLIGFVLNYSPWGFRLYPVLLALTGFVLAASLVAWWRRRRLAGAERPVLSLAWRWPRWGALNQRDRIISLVLIMVILGATGLLGYMVVIPKPGQEFTEFYLLGPGGKAADYPSELKVGEPGRVTAAIVNQEHQTVSYRLELVLNGVTAEHWGPVALAPMEKWEQAVTFSLSQAGDMQKVEFVLYRAGDSQPYLKPLHLWIDVHQ